MQDRWTGGDDYERYMGRWSRPVADRFLEWLAIPAGLDWVDVGCGAGALTAAILGRAEPEAVVGADPSVAFVAHARAVVNDARATFREGGAAALPLGDRSADAVVSGLVLNFVPDLAAGLQEMARVARPAGTIAGYVWDYAGEMQLIKRFWDAAVALDPSAAMLDEGTRFPICAPRPLRDAFEDAGLLNVEVESIEVPTVFRDFDDYWSPFLSGVGPAPGYAAGLDEASRDRLRDRLRATLRTGPDGSIHLVAGAWAVRGEAPGVPS